MDACFPDKLHKESHYFQITEIKNLGHDGLLKAYAERQASDKPYDVNAKAVKYIGPEVVAKSLADSIPERERCTVRVLDVGAGTGLVAEKLAEYGFCSIDALEPSAELLKDAKEKRLYKEYHEIFLTGEHCGITTNKYDAIACCGCLIENHLQIEALNEMIRLVKPGGHIVVCGRYSTLLTVEAYKDKLIPYMDKLEEGGKWRKVTEEKVPNYLLDCTGVLWKYQVA